MIRSNLPTLAYRRNRQKLQRRNLEYRGVRMNLIIREMKPDEAKEIQALGTRVFLSSFESFFVSKPKTAKVAEIDGEIVGGFIYAIEKCGEKKLGLIDFLFVKSSHAGKGIGGRLCREGISFLWDEGCDYLATFIRDDNVGSWAAFEKNGFKKADLFKFTGALGGIGFLKTYFNHIFCICIGCDIYLASRPNVDFDMSKFKKNTGFSQISLHVITNFILMIIFLVSATGYAAFATNFSAHAHRLLLMLPALFIMFGGVVFFAYIGTLFSRRREWRYRMPSGGLLVCVVFAVLGAFIPMAGNFYPEKYENSAEFRRDMGLSALLPWLFLLGLYILTDFFGDSFRFIGGGFQAAVGILLLIRCIPFTVINLGSVRVFRWSKVLCLILAATSIYLVFVL